jgi:hypothetical protein
MGSPSASVQSNYLVSPTLNTVVYNSLHSSGSSVFGAGVLGANYSTTSTGTNVYTATNTHEYNLSGDNSFTLGLLTMGAYNSGFTSLTFTVAEGATNLLTKTFTSLSAAQTYFTDDPVSLGNITGAVDLKLSYTLTAAAAQGAGISYLVADGPVTDTRKPIATAVIARPINSGAELTAALAKYNTELSTLSAKAAASTSAHALSSARKTAGLLAAGHALSVGR